MMGKTGCWMTIEDMPPDIRTIENLKNLAISTVRGFPAQSYKSWNIWLWMLHRCLKSKDWIEKGEWCIYERTGWTGSIQYCTGYGFQIFLPPFRITHVQFLAVKRASDSDRRQHCPPLSGEYAKVDCIHDNECHAAGSRGVYFDDLYSSKEDLMKAMFDEAMRKTAEIKASIQTKDDCIRFMFSHTVSCAEE